MSYPTRRQQKRDTQRRVMVAQMAAPITAEVRGEDPLERGPSGRLIKLTRVIVLTAAAGLAHLVVLGCFFVVGLGAAGADAHTKDEKVTVAIVETLPEIEVVEPIEAPEPEVAVKSPEAEPEVVKPQPKPKKSKPKPKLAKKSPPPDPTEEPQKAEKPSDTPKPRRRIVGLNLESTTTGGGGPSFAVGTTRMGSTASRANDPKFASRRPAAKGLATKSEPSAAPNKVAIHTKDTFGEDQGRVFVGTFC
jgi:outer membrane biosynthesis protein TonB